MGCLPRSEPVPPPGCRSFQELHVSDCENATEAEIEYYLSCCSILQLEGEDSSYSSD
jgi:hypothetical protein